MTQRLDPIYLERKSYRRRRLQDAARILPFLGILLFFLPLLWSNPAEGARAGPGTAVNGLLLFGIWFLLIVGAAALSRSLLESDPNDEAGSPDA